MATQLLERPSADTAGDALLALLAQLRARGYRFVTPTPATHARILARPDRQRAKRLEDALGWSLPFAEDDIDPEIVALLRAADALEPAGQGLLRSRLRVSALHDMLFLHSAYPTEATDSVFFGPDSYRFADFIAAELGHAPLRPEARILDIGAGAGVGGLAAARLSPGAHAVLSDINPKANRLACLNARAAGLSSECVEGETPPDGPFDLAMANPPYMIDEAGRDYRDGGGMHGAEIALSMTADGLARLAPAGRFLLYTGSAIVRGEDRLRVALQDLAAEGGWTMRYRELDPDVFGEDLDQPAYADVDRIAVVGAVFTRGLP
jgi:methylase of polypeptide subunit release factors